MCFNQKVKFFSSFKLEFGKASRFPTIEKLTEGIGQHIFYYNTRRIHSAFKMPPQSFHLEWKKKHARIGKPKPEGVWNSGYLPLHIREKMGIGVKNGVETPPTLKKNRNRLEKSSCKPMSQEENQEKGPRCSWALTHLGNVRLYLWIKLNASEEFRSQLFPPLPYCSWNDIPAALFFLIRLIITLL